MSPIPIGNPRTALRLSTRYDLKGKVGLQHDEILVGVSLMEDLTPAPPAMEFERVDATAATGVEVEANGTGPALGFRRHLRHLSIAVRFTADAAIGDVAVALISLVNPVANLSLHGVILEAAAGF